MTPEIAAITLAVVVGLIPGYVSGFYDGRKKGVAIGWLERDDEAKKQQKAHAAKKLRNFNAK
jgi:hypothetical protein